MKPGITIKILITLIALGITACASTPAPEPVDYRADIQKIKAEKAQQELSEEMSKQK